MDTTQYQIHSDAHYVLHYAILAVRLRKSAIGNAVLIRELLTP